MNLLLLDNADFVAPDTVRVAGRRFEHLRDVIGLAVGKSYRAGVLDGRTGVATVRSVAADSAELATVFDQSPPPPLPLTLICALPRPKSFRKVLHGALSMGVKRLYFINSWKVDKSYWQSPLLTAAELETEIRLALEQSGDTVRPAIEFRRRFKVFVEDELPLLASGATGVFGDPRSETVLPFRPAAPVVLAVGPEGGFTDYESGALQAAGLTGVSLGRRVLRTEFAVVALIAGLGF